MEFALLVSVAQKEGKGKKGNGGVRGKGMGVTLDWGQ